MMDRAARIEELAADGHLDKSGQTELRLRGPVWLWLRGAGADPDPRDERPAMTGSHDARRTGVCLRAAN